jgi:hypothetical protein
VSPDGAFARDAQALLGVAAPPGSPGAKRVQRWLDPLDGGDTLGTRWLDVAAQIVQQRHLDPAAATGIYARVALVEADTLLATWADKYRFDRGRPATAVADSNPGSAWQPASTPPPSPEFPDDTIALSSAAAHAVDRGARRELTFPDIDGTHVLWAGNATAFVQQIARNAVVSGNVFPATVAPSLQLGKCVAVAVELALGN